jgi:hypothetical protein
LRRGVECEGVEARGDEMTNFDYILNELTRDDYSRDDRKQVLKLLLGGAMILWRGRKPDDVERWLNMDVEL